MTTRTAVVSRLSAGLLALLTLTATIFGIEGLWPRAARDEGRPVAPPPRAEERAPALPTFGGKLIPESRVRSGDIIFRRGLSLESRAIMAMDGNFGYSHAGIIRKRGSEVEVIHASYAEEGQTQEVLISEPIERFLKPSSSTAAVVYRLDGEDRTLPLVALSEAERFLEAKTPFDKEFDLTTADRIYCTELVWLSFKKAGIDLTGGRFDRVPHFIGDPEKIYILPSSLLNSSHLHKVWDSQ